MKIKHLTIKWTVSKGRDTYGYNIVTLYDTSTRKRFRANGGGYDMTGTVFGDWLESEYQAELMKIKERAYYQSGRNGLMSTDSEGKALGDLYGMTSYQDFNRISLDGACGLDSMVAIAEAIGLTVQRIPDAKGSLIGFNVVEG